MSRAAACVLLAATSACVPRPAGPAPGAAMPAGEARTDATVVSLERTPCFGTCPVYAVTISGNGLVRFTGIRYTAHIGEATAEIPPERVDSLVAALRAGGYFGFADAYVLDAPACGLYSTDSPTVITSVTDGDMRKEIRHDYGCSDAPPALNALERRIDEAAGSARWTGR